MIALIIVGSWFCHLCRLLSVALSWGHIPSLLAAILLQTFLDTGLFITAHDAIHGSVYPANRSINQWLGRLCAIAYAFLPYNTLAVNHWLHHRHPMSATDPDFHGTKALYGIKPMGFLTWYLHFIQQYWGWKQFLRLAGVVGLVGFVFRLSPINLGLFWGLPLVLSSLQLFYFGTYRPHQAVNNGQTCAKSQVLPWMWSLLACYHFGYHQEHHDRPDIPWWALPTFYHSQLRQTV
ncbi:MAG: fatty acid desaturase [Cyanobacteria bacterium P01_A01_bin.114]